MRTTAVCAWLAALAFTGCSPDKDHDRPPVAPGGTGGAAAHGGGHHGESLALGTAEVGGFSITARRGKVLTPGEVTDVDLEFAAGKPLPPLARAWIGTQDAAGSVKCKLDREGERVLHGHLEVQKPLPAGSRLWVEVETSGGAKASGSFDLKQ